MNSGMENEKFYQGDAVELNDEALEKVVGGYGEEHAHEHYHEHDWHNEHDRHWGYHHRDRDHHHCHPHRR